MTENIEAAELRAQIAELERIVVAQTVAIAELRAAPVATQEPVGFFNGKFDGDVNGNMWFTVKAYDAIPEVGAKLYTAAQPRVPPVPDGYVIKRVEGHGWIVYPRTGYKWTAHDRSPIGDFFDAFMAPAPPTAGQAQQDDSPLPRPSIHTAQRYSGFLRRIAHNTIEPTRAAAIRNAAVMIELLNAECGRLHQELIDQQDAEKVDAFDRPCVERDGCPTEIAVLQRYWRKHQTAPQPDPAMAGDDRETFEAWASKEGYMIERSRSNPRNYRVGQMQIAWMAWQEVSKRVQPANGQVVAQPAPGHHMVDRKQWLDFENWLILCIDDANAKGCELLRFFIQTGAAVAENEEGYFLHWHTSNRRGPLAKTPWDAIELARREEYGL